MGRVPGSRLAERPRVVIVGGGAAGGLLARLLEEDADVTLVDLKDYFEVTWGTLRCFVQPALAERVLFPHQLYLRQARVLVGRAAAVSASAVVLADGRSLPFDFAVVASGSTPQQPLDLLGKRAFYAAENKRLQAAERVLIIGGGASGVELAAEILSALPQKRVTLVHSGPQLLDWMLPAAGARALAWLQAHGADVILNDRMLLPDPAQRSGVFHTRGGREIETDLLFNCVRSRPDCAFLRGAFSYALTADGQVEADPQLRVRGAQNIFAVGDVVALGPYKQGYLAQAQAKVVAHNIKALMRGPSGARLKAYKPATDASVLAIVPLGENDGLAQLGFLGVVGGLLPTMIKSKGLFIDKTRGDLGIPKDQVGDMPRLKAPAREMKGLTMISVLVAFIGLLGALLLRISNRLPIVLLSYSIGT